MPEFIGDREIKSFEAKGDGSTVSVEFVDGFKTTLSGTLFFYIKSEEKGNGGITDQINHYFAKKFIAELAEEGLEYYFVDNIGMAMKVLAHNLREEAIKKAFDGHGGDSIPLLKLVPSEETYAEEANTEA